MHANALRIDVHHITTPLPPVLTHGLPSPWPFRQFLQAFMATDSISSSIDLVWHSHLPDSFFETPPVLKAGSIVIFHPYTLFATQKQNRLGDNILHLSPRLWTLLNFTSPINVNVIVNMDRDPKEKPNGVDLPAELT